MVGGNLRLTQDSGNSNIGKTATVYIVVDDEYVLYHNSNQIGAGTLNQTGVHTFTITGNDRLGITAQNNQGRFGVAFVVVVDNEIVLTSNKRDTVAVKNLPGTFSPRWNVDFNLFNVENNVPIDGNYAPVMSKLLATLQQPSINLDGGDVENIWANGATEMNRNFFFQTRLQEVSQAYVKGTNQRGSSAIQFIEGANATGEITFLRATDTNDNSYFVNESARFDEQGRFGIGTTKPQQALDIVGNIRSSGPYIFLQNDGYPQLVLSNADGATKRFGVWRNKNSDQMLLGPQSGNGNGKASIIINRNATIAIPEGGKVNVVNESDPDAIVNKQYVDTQIATGGLTAIGKSDVFQATGNLGGFEKGTLSRFNSILGSLIPTAGAGNHSHGKNFAGMLAATHSTDGGGLFLDVTDNNNDEHALSIYNTSTAINKEVFHIRSKTGDTYTAGDIYARGGIASETKVVIGDADNHFIVEKNNKNLVIGNRDGSPSTALTIAPSGQVSIQHEPIADAHVATKKYVDKTLNSQVITTLPRFASTTGNFLDHSSATYSANNEFSFTIGDICNLTAAELARVYAVDVTIHNFAGGKKPFFFETSFKYPDGNFKTVQAAHGVNGDDDCGGSASVLLPVTGSKVTFKSNRSGNPASSGLRQVVINGFWYYDVESTPGISTTSFPGLDQFDIDILLLPNLGSRHPQLEAYIKDYLTIGVQHDILRNSVARPTTTNSPDWAQFDELLLPSSGNPQFGILATSPNFDPADTDLPTSTYDKIKEFIILGGTLFIFSDYTATNGGATRSNPRIESLIQELGGIKGIATGDSPILNSQNIHSEWMHLTAPPTTTFRTGDGAATLGVVDRNFTFRGGATGSIVNSKSNGVSLAGTNAQAHSVIHMWDNSLQSGSLSSGVQGSIVWFGDVNFNNISGVMQPLLTYIAST